MWYTIHSRWLFFLLLLPALALNAQPKTNSPYSRLGLGDPMPLYFANQAAWGGLTAGFRDVHHLNIQNPASLGFLKSTSFESGLFARYAALQGDNESANVWAGNLSYLALGFPLINPINENLEKKEAPIHWGMAIALSPFTNIGYNIQTTEISAIEDTTTNNFRGTGGTYILQWSNGVRWKNLSVGLTLGYFFGNINNDREVIFNDLGVAYQNLFKDAISLRGLTWNAGVQYDLALGEDRRLIIGVSGHSATAFTANSNNFYRGINFSYPDTDTAVNVRDVAGEGRLPAEFSAGAVYEKGTRWRLGLEYAQAGWSEYTNEAREETLSDTRRIAFGVQFAPDITSYNQYLRRIRYRAGFYYQTDPRSTETLQLTQYAMTLGAGLPVVLPRQQASYVNAAVELGQFGSPENLREWYIRLTVGFTLNDDSWFFKRKFF